MVIKSIDGIRLFDSLLLAPEKVLSMVVGYAFVKDEDSNGVKLIPRFCDGFCNMWALKVDREYGYVPM